jgi:uncharacterized membrane protein YcaP (DUF421 family)
MDVVIRASIVFVLLFLLLRIVGKRQLGQMTAFEFVGLVVLGDFVQQAVTHNDFSITAAGLAVTTFAFWSLLFGWITYRSKWGRRLFESQPLVLIKDGAFIDQARGHDLLPREEILSEMRLAGIERLADVKWAILEPNGKVSFIEKTKRA